MKISAWLGLVLWFRVFEFVSLVCMYRFLPKFLHVCVCMYVIRGEIGERREKENGKKRGRAKVTGFSVGMFKTRLFLLVFVILIN